MVDRKSVLLLGNGVSRIKNRAVRTWIDKWIGETWGCNWAFLEFPVKLSRVVGEPAVMEEAKEFQKENHTSYTVYKRHAEEGAESMGLEAREIADSGTNLLGMALKEGYDLIYLAGFDGGGRELYTGGYIHERWDEWRPRWDAIAKEFDADIVWMSHAFV